MKTRLARATYLRVGFLFLYIGSYLILSALGEYTSVRATWISAMIRVDWAPVGFVLPRFGWNYGLEAVYFPVYTLDSFLWHRDRVHSVMTGPLRYAN